MSDKQQTNETEEEYTRRVAKFAEVGQTILDLLDKEMTNAGYGDLAALWITKEVAQSLIVELSKKYKAQRMLDVFCHGLRQTVKQYNELTSPAETDQIRH